jgi:tetratricopeptide (TPR) repeat protein
MSNDALIAKYEALLKSRPDDELLRFSLGKALLDAGRMDEAERELRAALAAKEDWMIVTMLLAKIAGQKGDKAPEPRRCGRAACNSRSTSITRDRRKNAGRSWRSLQDKIAFEYPRFLWLRFATPPGQQVVRASRCRRATPSAAFPDS